MTRRYFTNILEALHMMTYFGVKFEVPLGEGTLSFELWKIDAENVKELLEYLGSYCPAKLYVCKESEPVFEPKDYDSGLIRGEHLGTYDDGTGRWQYTHEDRCYEYVEHGTTTSRDNKRFYTGEVEDV